MTDEEQAIAYEAIKEAHHHGTLQHLIGNALGKNAVLLVLVDVVGQVTFVGDSRASTPTAKRDRAMLLQMTELLNKNMKDMMREAGKESREESKA